MFGRCAVYGPVPGATCGEEAGLLIFGEVVPDRLGLEIVEYIGEPALEGLHLVAEWLLEV